MDTIGRKFRGLELWETEDVSPEITDEATAAALAVLDDQGVSPLEARVAQFTLEALDDKGLLDDGSDPSKHGLNMMHLSACRAAETAAKHVIERLSPNRARPYLRLGVAEWALNEWQTNETDPTKA